MRIAREPFDADLVAESARELVQRYGADTEPGGPPASVDVFLVARDEAGEVLGSRRLVLETGSLQPDAIALYEGSGYRAIPCFGAYAGNATSRCYERRL